jgi:prepilin-type N-terminal cleavage/methylation domain-containing protein
MTFYTPSKSKAFTIVELMVVVAIIGILLTIVLASIMEARKDSRDKRRVSDIANIELGLTLYKEKNREYPNYPSGVELGHGGALDDDIKLFNGNVYSDPLSSGSNSEYGYWYYSNFLCNGERVNVIISKKMEKESNGNYNEVCGGGEQLPYEDKKHWFIPRAYAGGGGGSRSACVVRRFSANPATLPVGGGTTAFTWRTENVKATGVSIDNGVGSGLRRNNYQPPIINVSKAITQTTTFTLTGDGTSGRPDCTKTVTVTVPTVYTQGTYYAQANYAWGANTEAVYVQILKQ